MEATGFTGWICDHLRPHTAALKVAHPLMLRAIAAAKKKNDRVSMPARFATVWAATSAIIKRLWLGQSPLDEGRIRNDL